MIAEVTTRAPRADVDEPPVVRRTGTAVPSLRSAVCADVDRIAVELESTAGAVLWIGRLGILALVGFVALLVLVL